MGLEATTVSKAVHALCQHVEVKAKKNKLSLIDGGEMIHVMVGLKKMPQNGTNKPKSIRIPHPIYSNDRGTQICVFVKDSISSELKENLSKNPVSEVKKIIGLDKLRKNYSQHAQRRELCDSYDIFLADDRITPMLPKALGSVFFEKKKNPIPITIPASKNLTNSVKAACHCTYLHLGWGVTSSVRVATTEFPENHIAENIIAAVNGIAEAVPKKWKNIQSINIKTTDSIALPIYNSLPTEEDDDEEEEIKDVEMTDKKEEKKSSKKRSLSSGPSEEKAAKKKKVEATHVASTEEKDVVIEKNAAKNAATVEKKAVIVNKKVEEKKDVVAKEAATLSKKTEAKKVGKAEKKEEKIEKKEGKVEKKEEKVEKKEGKVEKKEEKTESKSKVAVPVSDVKKVENKKTESKVDSKKVNKKTGDKKKKN